MVHYVKDRTGRFNTRPQYSPAELDHECEKIITDYLSSIRGEACFPVDTEDLKNLIERDADELDCYADLSEFGDDVEGVTEFRPGKKPLVKVSARLTEDSRYENRLRTTLTHEYGHVKFHAYLFDLERQQGNLFDAAPGPQRLISKRENIIGAPQTDWMEWQAGYICGGILMPISHVRRIEREFRARHDHVGPVSAESSRGQELISLIMQAFRVSQDAARVRLSKLGILGQERGPSLFSTI